MREGGYLSEKFHAIGDPSPPNTLLKQEGFQLAKTDFICFRDMLQVSFADSAKPATTMSSQVLSTFDPALAHAWKHHIGAEIYLNALAIICTYFTSVMMWPPLIMANSMMDVANRILPIQKWRTLDGQLGKMSSLFDPVC